MQGPCPPRRAGGSGLPVALLLLPAGLPGCSAGASDSGPWLFGTVALLFTAGASYALGNLRSQQRSARALREANRALHDLAGLVACWTWQTDADNRLLHLVPPATVDAGTAPAEVGDSMPDRFDSDQLRQLLRSQRAFVDLRVRGPAGGASWVLSAAPRFDDAGRFAGYGGTARPTGAADGARTDQGALHALLAALDTPVLLAAGDGSAGGWQVRHANPAARRLLDADAPGWPQVLAKMPQVVRDALAAGRVDAGERDGWLLRTAPADDGQTLLMLKAPQAGDAERGESASFSFTLSHDLRAPIRVVEGFTRILKEDYGRLLDRVGNDHLDRVLGAAARMNHMIDALLALAKLSQQPLARQPVNLSQLAAYVVDDLRRSAPERTADIEIEPGMLVHGDPTLLRLVLENLLGNAWKYSARVKKAQIVFGRETIEGRQAYVVRDNGAGFDMRSADRLFGLFQRLHSAADFAGTGVGLASVKRIVQRHGGDVWADAEPGRGAAFHFTLRD